MRVRLNTELLGGLFGMALAAIVGVVLNLVLPGKPAREESEQMFDALGD